MTDNTILFKDDQHKARYNELLTAYNAHKDPYTKALAYLITLANETYNHRSGLYNAEERHIIPDGISEDWQTGTTTKLTLLAFNLYTSSLNFCPDELTADCTPDNIFCSDLAPYFWQAIKIRYPEYTAE